MSRGTVDSVERYAIPGEQVRAAFSAYTPWGFSRRLVAVTDQRILLFKSPYWSVHAERLLWADPIGRVALREVVPWFLCMARGSEQGGNFYLQIRRADGRKLMLNMRQSFIGRHSSASETIVALQSLVPRSN